MSNFDPAAHPRGQAGNRGQFRAKANRVPARALTDSDHERQYLHTMPRPTDPADAIREIDRDVNVATGKGRGFARKAMGQHGYTPVELARAVAALDERALQTRDPIDEARYDFAKEALRDARMAELRERAGANSAAVSDELLLEEAAWVQRRRSPMEWLAERIRPGSEAERDESRRTAAVRRLQNEARTSAAAGAAAAIADRLAVAVEIVRESDPRSFRKPLRELI